jgi:hypothetical protein
MKGYCAKEGKRRGIVSPKSVTFKNGRHAIKGNCASCGTILFGITGN